MGADRSATHGIALLDPELADRQAVVRAPGFFDDADIALVHEAQGNKQEAKAMFLRCERAYAQAYGPQHSETVDARERAASCE